MHCENCGASLKEDSRFCSECGTEVQGSANQHLNFQRDFARERRRSSSRQLQTIILISVPVLLFGIVMAWLIIPSTFQSTRRSEEHSALKFNTPIADNLSPSDSEVQRILDKLYNKSYHRILVGDAAVTAGANNIDRKEISADEFKGVVAWSQAGLIDLVMDDVLSNSERLKSHLKRIKVTPTAKGVQFQRDSNIREPLDPKFLYARFYTIMVSDIIENREVKKNVELYRVVKGTQKIRFNEVGEKVYSIAGLPMISQQNFIFLLKRDPFKNEWDVVSADYAEASGHFKSNNVEQYLAAH
jgi:hypothetical protein